MASEADKEGGVANQENRDDGVSIDLPAPEGWRKIFTPRRGGTPRRNDVVFISPTGEEIRSRRQIEQYLKSHPSNLSTSDFDWGTGDTPRRSARIVQKSKATETPEGVPPQKRQNKSSSKKEEKEKKDDIDGEGEEAVEEKVEETKASEEVEMKDVEDVGGDKSKGEVADKEDLATKDTEKDSEPKVEEKVEETDIEKLENQEVDNKATSDTPEKQGVINSLPSPGMEEQTGDNSLPAPGMEENKVETEKQLAETEAPTLLPVPDETASSEKEAVTVKEVFPKADAKVENESEEAKMGPEDPTEKVANVGEVKPDKDSSKEGQDVAKPMENHSARCEEAPHEPKASPVSC